MIIKFYNVKFFGILILSNLKEIEINVNDNVKHLFVFLS